MKIRKLPFIYIIALLYFIFSFTLIYLKWRAHTPSLDYHAYLQMFWNTANGDIMMYNRSSESQYSLFSAHFAPFLLLIFPFYVLVKHPLTLYFVWMLLISSSIIPLYYFSLDKLKSKLSAYLISLSFLIYFPFLWTHRHGFAEESLATPLLFFAFFFLHRKKPWLYLIFSVLTLSLRINMVLPVFLLGFYSVIKKRARSQGIFVCLLSIFWFLFTMNVIYPAYTSPGERFYIYGFFGGYGNNPKEVLINMISKPLTLLTTFISKLKLIYDLFGPVLFLPFLAPEILFIGMPILIINILASYPRLSNSWTYYHSSSLPFIWLGLAIALERVGRFWELLCEKLKFNKPHFVRLHFLTTRSFAINFILVVILITNFTIDKNTPNGQHMPFSKSFNLRTYEINIRDGVADKILSNIPKTNSVAAQHSYLEHTAERKWQFPNSSFSGYAADILMLDMWAPSSDFIPVLKEEPYIKILEDSFFFLYARQDITKEYDIKEFIDNAYKYYDANSEYLVVSTPANNYSTYSGVEPGISINISDTYKLVQRLDIKNDNPRILEIPIELSLIEGPNNLLELTKKTVGNLKVEILEGDDFRKDYKIAYSKIYLSKDLTHKTTLIYLDLKDINFDVSKKYWLKLSLDKTKKGSKEIFNRYTIYLTTANKADDDKSATNNSLYYSLDAGKEWSPDMYPGKSLAYSIEYGAVTKSYLENTLESSTYIIKGAPDYLKGRLEKISKYDADYKSVVVVGSITEKL